MKKKKNMNNHFKKLIEKMAINQCIPVYIIYVYIKQWTYISFMDKLSREKSFSKDIKELNYSVNKINLINRNKIQ